MMKYIVIAVEGEELPFLFDERIVHSDMLESVRAMRVGRGQGWSRPYRGAACIAAGFITPRGHCFGESESIGVGSRGEVDDALINSKHN